MIKNNQKILIGLLVVIVLVASLYLGIIIESAKITTFEECEKAGWLVRGIKVYDGFGPIEKECVLWSGKSFQEYNITSDSLITIKFSTYGGFMPFEEARRDFTVSNDGLAVLEIKDGNGSITSTNSVNLGRARVEQLTRLFLDNQFFNLKSQYTTPKGVEVADAGVREIYLKINNIEKTVIIDPYVLDYLPKNLKEINDEILNLIDFVKSSRPTKKGGPIFTFEVVNDGQCTSEGTEDPRGEFLPKEPDLADIPFSGHIITPTPCDSIEMRSATKEINNIPTLDLIISDKPSLEPCIECLGISKFNGKLLFWPKGIEQVRLIYKEEVLDVIKKPVNTSSSTPFFPVANKPSEDSMTALLEGELSLEDGCLRVSDRGYDNYLLVWPYGFSLNTDENGVIQVIDDKGQPVARVGDKVKIGGGECVKPCKGISNYSAQLPSDRCSGPYWIVGEVIADNESNN